MPTLVLAKRNYNELLHILDNDSAWFSPDDYRRLAGVLRLAAHERKPRPSTVARRSLKNLSRRRLVEKVRSVVADRAGGLCECGCGQPFLLVNPAEWDEFRGRAKATSSVENTWMLRRGCHRQKGAHRPSREYWLRAYACHCIKYGYLPEARWAEGEIKKIMSKDVFPF